MAVLGLVTPEDATVDYLRIGLRKHFDSFRGHRRVGS